MKMTIARTVSLLMSFLLILGMLGGLTACGETNEPTDTTESATEVPTLLDDTTAAMETEEEDHRFDGMDYKGRSFRIYTSINYLAESTSGSSNHLIEGGEEMGASVAGDAVIERNLAVEELLGVTLEFTQSDIPYPEVAAKIRTLLSAGDDEFDVIINKLFPLVNLSIEGSFRNTLSPECVFDFERSYWYEDYMADLRLVDDRQHILGGDFFVDIIRSAAGLLYNQTMYEDHFKTDPDEVYTWVKNHEWTFEKLTEITSDFYLDVNQNNQIDEGDRFGMVIGGYWGPTIAMVIAADPGFVTREEDGTPVMALAGSQRASDLVERLRELNKSSGFNGSVVSATNTLKNFINGLALVSDGVSLGGLENTLVRDMEDDMGVIPYPLLYSGDDYITSTGDVTEVGVIPITSRDLAFVSTVLEVLNRESARTLIPVYYKECLQIQYVRDPNASEMVELIHDNIAGSFILGYNNQTGSVMLNVFGQAMEQDRTFEAAFKKLERTARNGVKNMVIKYQQNNSDD